MNLGIAALLGYMAGASMADPEGAKAMALLGIIMVASAALSCVLWGLWHAAAGLADLIRYWARK